MPSSGGFSSPSFATLPVRARRRPRWRRTMSDCRYLEESHADKSLVRSRGVVARPRATGATRRRPAGHAQSPPFLAAGRDAAIDAARAVVRAYREGVEQPAEMRDFPGDAT